MRSWPSRATIRKGSSILRSGTVLHHGLNTLERKLSLCQIAGQESAPIKIYDAGQADSRLWCAY